MARNPRDRLQKDWESYATLKDLLYAAPPFFQDKPDVYTEGRDAELTRLKELFMYGEPTIEETKTILDEIEDDHTLQLIREWLEKRNKKASGGLIDLYRYGGFI